MRQVLSTKSVPVLAACLALALSAGAEVAVELRRAAVLDPGRIRLGQIAEIAADEPGLAERLATVVLGATPWPGNARVLTRDNVSMYLRRAGVDPSAVRWAGPRSCTVTVHTARITPQEIVETGRQYLRSLPLLGGDDVTIRAERMPPPKLVAVGREPVTLSASAPSADRPWGRIRVHVRVQAGDRVVATVPVMFLVSARRKVLFAARPLARSEPIGPDDLEVREMVLGPGSGPEIYLRDKAQAVGKRAARAIAAGVPLTASMILEPYAARKGESVSIRLRTRHLEVVTKGVAGRDARVGEVIPVTVEISGRKLSCKVTGAGTVELSM